MFIWLAVFIRILANPFSNVFQKILTRKGADPLFVIALPLAALAALLIPLYPFLLPGVRAGFWPNITICAVLAVSGNAMLVQALKLSDLSVLGPINAYKSVVSLVPGVILLHEVPRPLALLGIALIIAGSYFLLDKQVNQPRRNLLLRFFADRGTQFRFAALILSALEAVFLKRAVLASTPFTTFAGWCLLGSVFAAASVLAVLAQRLPREVEVARANWRPYALLAGTTGLMQITTLVTFGALQVGYALALFQTSTLLTVLLGRHFFDEGHFLERLLGSAVMVAGAVLIIVGR